MTTTQTRDAGTTETLFVNELLKRCLLNTGLLPDLGQGTDACVIDWELAPGILKAHGLAPLAATVLENHPRGFNAPDAMLPFLRQELDRAARQHKLSLVMLKQIDQQFRTAGLPYAVLKGPQLYEQFYRDLFPRPCADIDILILHDDLEKALQLLSSLGYLPAGSRMSRFFMRHCHFHIVLEHQGGTLLALEVHWDLVDQANLYRINVHEVLERRAEIEAGNVRFTGLSDEDNLIYLCVHVAKHGLLNPIGLADDRPGIWFCHPNADNRMIWFIDIMLLLRGREGKFNWPKITDRVRRKNVGEDIATTLSLLALLFPESDAELAISQMEVNHQRPQTACERLLLRILHTPHGQTIFRRSLQMHPSFFFRPARFFLLLRVLFPSADQMHSYYGPCPAWKLVIKYALHPFHMLAKVFG